MTEKRSPEQPPPGNMEKDPDRWVTGDEPMTGAQRSYLQTLSEEAGQPFDATLTKAQASKRIEELQAMTGRGLSTPTPEERARGDEGALESMGRAITAPLLDADDGTPPQPSHNGPPGRSGPDGPAERSPAPSNAAEDRSRARTGGSGTGAG